MNNVLFLWRQSYTTLSDIYNCFSKRFFLSENDIDTTDGLLLFININQIKYVVIQNPYLNEKRLNIFNTLKEKRIKLFISDRGALPNSWFFDSDGFNAGSKLYNSSYWDKPLTEEKKKKVFDYIKVELNSDTSLEKQGIRLKSDKLREKLKIEKNKKVLFVPLQRPSDTVIKYFSKNVKDMEHFLQNILSIQEALKDEWVVLVKKHPLEHDRLYEDKLNYVEDDTHFKDLIELSSAIVLINSGVGVISMMYQKPLFYFGNVFYGDSSINKEVKNSDEVIEHINNGLYTVDFEKVQRFISYLIDDFYSFGDFITTQRQMDDGTKRTITTKINFNHLRGLPQKSKQKTLLVTDIDFFKADIGNRQRILRIIQYLNQHLNLKVLFLKNITKNDKEKIQNYQLEYIIDYIDEIKVTNKDISTTITSHSKSLEEFYNPEIKAKFNKYLKTNDFDNIIVEYIRLDYLINDKHDKYQTFIDTHDLMSLRAESYEKNNDKHHILISREEEYQILEKYKYILSIQKNEYDLLTKNTQHNKNILVYHAVDIYNQYKNNTVLKNITFISGPANYKHIAWFIENVWKYFVNDDNFNLNIHGSVCQSLQQYSGVKNIKLYGYAKDLQKIYNNSDVVINPVLYGGGLKIKNVEALSNGIPLITTNEGANGIEDGISYAFLLANTVDEWIEALLSLKNSNELRDKLSQNAIRYSNHYFSDKNCYSELIEKLKDTND